MILLHAGFLTGQILLWGEIPANAEAPRSRSKEPRTGHSETPCLPFEACQDRLRQAFKEAGLAWRPGHDLLQTAIIWLPTIHKQPAPGSPLIAEPLPLNRPPKLAPWKINVIRLSWATAWSFSVPV